MKINLFPLLCLVGAVNLVNSQTVRHKYTLILTKMSWTDAQTYCRNHFEDLATVQSAADWLKLAAEAQRKSLSLTDTAWLGLYNDIDGWRWSYKDTPLKNQAFTSWWGGGEPNNLNGVESCAMLDSLANWLDRPCSEIRSFFCYDERFTGAASFFSIPIALNWTDAQTYCRTSYTDLAPVYTSAVNSMLQPYTTLVGSWTGLYRDTWKWSDGENVSKIPWNPGQPDNFYSDENCAYMNYYGMFDDDSCSSLRYFFCHITRPVRIRQTVRLHISSDQDLNDPTVLSSLMNLLKQKLEEGGMLTNTSVTWRQPPGGLIFHRTTQG